MPHDLYIVSSVCYFLSVYKRSLATYKTIKRVSSMTTNHKIYKDLTFNNRLLINQYSLVVSLNKQTFKVSGLDVNDKYKSIFFSGVVKQTNFRVLESHCLFRVLIELFKHIYVGHNLRLHQSLDKDRSQHVL